MNWLFILLGIALALFLIIVIIRSYLTKKRIVNAFKVGNVLVEGPKGYGKDVLFQVVIKARNEKYFANYSYGGNYESISMKDLELTPNDYHHFINGQVEKIKKNPRLESHDIYFADGGIICPSQADSYLHKIYPSLPITYAINRHLYNNGIHINTQRIERVWKALREQSDYYISLYKRRLNLPFFIVIFTREYDKYESAVNRLAPMPLLMFNKYAKSERALYKAKHGFIKNGLIIVPKRILKYDTRAFHELLFGEKAPRKEKSKLCKILLNVCSKTKNLLKSLFKSAKKRK